MHHRVSAIMTLLGFITTIMILTSSSGFLFSYAPVLGQEDDLGNFSIMNTTALAGSNASQVYVIQEPGEEEPTTPPSSEAPRSEAPQSEQNAGARLP